MVFVDGSNFLTQLGRTIEVVVRPEKPKDACVTVACEIVNWITSRQLSNWRVIRRYWFGSYQGNDVDEARLRRTLRASHFEPVIFKRHDNKEKGVDIALTKEVLVNAFADNYELCYLVAGDEDYVVLVNEVKRYGPVIWGAFIREGLSDRLRLSFDEFIILDKSDSTFAKLLDKFRAAALGTAV